MKSQQWPPFSNTKAKGTVMLKINVPFSKCFKKVASNFVAEIDF